MNGWVCRQAWTQEAICLKLQIIWPDFQAAIQAESPSSLPAQARGEWLGFSHGLTAQGPGWCTQVWSAEWEEAATRPRWQMAKWLGNVRALPVLDQHDSRGSVVPANTRQSSLRGVGMSHVRVWASPC